ncbi:hypothetical protein EON64_17670 [archaeon]|nr:MAG: hypothetical protein EON64_17670 [archaeon]
MQQSVAEEVNRRLAKATRELEEKYQRGEGGADASVDGPTGKAYQEKQLKKAEKRKQAKAKAENLDNNNTSKELQDEGEEEENEDGDEDYELRMIREQRLKQLQKEKQETLENIGKGHGQYREIVQDEFLAEVTSSLRVICHFYHRDFSRCAVMDHHLAKLAARHLETKFIKINAEKAPFFVNKVHVWNSLYMHTYICMCLRICIYIQTHANRHMRLYIHSILNHRSLSIHILTLIPSYTFQLIIRTMPTVVCFVDGIAQDKVVGFEGLTEGLEEGHEDEWPTVRLARLLVSKHMLRKDLVLDEEEVAVQSQQTLSQLRQKMFMQLDDEDVEDLDLEG